MNSLIAATTNAVFFIVLCLATTISSCNADTTTTNGGLRGIITDLLTTGIYNQETGFESSVRTIIGMEDEEDSEKTIKPTTRRRHLFSSSSSSDDNNKNEKGFLRGTITDLFKLGLYNEEVGFESSVRTIVDVNDDDDDAHNDQQQEDREVDNAEDDLFVQDDEDGYLHIDAQAAMNNWIHHDQHHTTYDEIESESENSSD
jgi:hypothetical protein